MATEPSTLRHAPERSAPIVSVRGVTKRYGEVAAVDDLHLDIAEGEFLSLLGPSGCGKTTLLRMIGGFEEPDEGDITLLGSSVIGVPANKRTVNTVFQAYALFPHMTVAENVAYGLRQRKVGITFIFVTHDQEEALSMSDRVVVMRDGRIEQIGSAQQVYESPASSFVASFIGKQNFAQATVRADGLLEAPDAIFAPATGINGFAVGHRVQATVRAESIRISATDPVRASNVATGTLAGSSFLGDVIQHIVITSAGRELLVRTSVEGSEPLIPGAPVWCSWEPRAIHVFAAEGATV